MAVAAPTRRLPARLHAARKPSMPAGRHARGFRTGATVHAVRMRADLLASFQFVCFSIYLFCCNSIGRLWWSHSAAARAPTQSLARPG